MAAGEALAGLAVPLKSGERRGRREQDAGKS
jgi:hypothetical protein